MFWTTILVATIVHLEIVKCIAFVNEPASATLYTNYIDDDYRSPYKREAVFTYPVIDEVDVLKPPTPNTIWKHYFAPLMSDGRYMRPIKANCQTELVYEKQILKEPERKSPTPAAKIDWTPNRNSVITPSQTPRPTKSALEEAMNWANYLYRNEPTPLKTEEVNMSPSAARKDPPEVVVRVNVDYKNNKKPIMPPRIKNLKNTIKEKVQDKIETVKENKKRIIRKMIPPSEPEDQEEEIVEEMSCEPENELYTRPERLLKKGKIQLKETRLSDHDSVVEVMVPVQNQESSSEEEDEEECGDRDDRDDRDDSDEDGEDCAEENAAPLCEDDNGRPIIKNRFVVLHLKDGDRVIKDPLIKFLAKV